MKTNNIIAVVVTVAIVIVAAWGIYSIGGDGYTIDAVLATGKAHTVMRHLKNGQYARAAEHISFVGQNREEAEAEWINGVTELFESTMTITSYKVYMMKEDDELITGGILLTAHDHLTNKDFNFMLRTGMQDDRFAFGYAIMVHSFHDERLEELEVLLRDTLSTWYAG